MASVRAQDHLQIVIITHSWMLVACMRVEPVIAIGPVVRLILVMLGSSITSRCAPRSRGERRRGWLDEEDARAGIEASQAVPITKDVSPPR